MKIFSYDSKFMGFLNTLVDVIVLNFLWTICCIPIVTIGASTIAAFSITLKMVEGTEGHIAKPFFKAFASNIKHGTVLTLLFGAVAYSAYLSYQLFWKAEGNPIFFLIACFILIFVLLWHSLYVFAIEARYANTLRNNLGNARKLFMGYIFRSIILILALAAEYFLLFFYCFMNRNSFSTILLILGILIGPVCMMMTISGFILPVFKQLDCEAAVASGEIDEETHVGGESAEKDHFLDEGDNADHTYSDY